MEVLRHPLPADVDSERLILGSLLLDHISHAQVFQLLAIEDFSLEKHRRIFAAMRDMDGIGVKIDRVTVASQLSDLKHLESIGGLTYLAYLDDGLPQLPNIESYITILREKSARRKLIVSSQKVIDECLIGDTTSTDLIAAAAQQLMEIPTRPNETAKSLDPTEAIESEGGIEKFWNPAPGSNTPWKAFTQKTGGYRRGELFVLAGNPSMGKSAAAMQGAMRVAEDGGGVQVFSLEMSRTSWLKRMICYRARVDGAKMRAGYLSDTERARLTKALYEISQWPIWIAEHGISTVSAIRAELRQRRVKRDIFMVVIDYLQLLQSVGKQSNRNAEVSEITRQLKLLATDEKVNVQLLSQLNRDNMKERRPPELRDLRESGSIEQDADAVAFVWRPEMLFRDREDLKGIAELILAKQRNGPTGKIELTWLGHLTAFENRADEMEP